MIARNPTLALILGAALAAGAAARADEITTDAAAATAVAHVTISGKHSCAGLSAADARRFAQDAQRAGAHARAAECFRVAGDNARADRAQIRATAATGADSAARVKAGLELTKAQVKRLRDSLR